MNKFGLSTETYNKIKKLLFSYPEIENVKIFGSRAKGNYKPYSDIDLVVFGNNITEKLLLHIAYELDELPTPYKFDIIDYKTISNEDIKKDIDNFSQEFVDN